MSRRVVIHIAAIAGLAAIAAAPPVLGSDGTGGRDLEQPPEAVAMELDLLIEGAWRREELQPNGPCTDEEFARRVYLDVVGTVPSAKQVLHFAKDDARDKRARLVDRLLDSAGYARHFANVWGKTLIGQGVGENNREFVPSLFQDWLEQQLRRNRPYSELVTEMLTATNTAYTNPPLNFSGRRNHNPADLAGAVSTAFLGVQIQCAQCHDHPYETITQKDFESFAAFFSRTMPRREQIPYEMFGAAAKRRADQRYEQQVKQLMDNGQGEEEARRVAERRRPSSTKLSDVKGPLPKGLARRAEQRYGDIAKAEPRFLLGDAYVDSRSESRRAGLAEWIVRKDNPYTARALANRYWGWLLGRGIVHPVDDFSSVNIPSVPLALDLLARDTAEHHFDLKRLVRVITATRAYQLSTSSPDRSPLAEEFFAAGPLKELSPQQTFDSIQVALGVREDGTTMTGVGAGAPSAMDMAAGRGGMMMGMGDPSSATAAQKRLMVAARSFFTTFDDDEGTEAEAFTGTIPQGLFLMNSPVINSLLVDPRLSVVPPIVDGFERESDRIRHLFLRTLSREPTPQELRRFVHFVKNAETVEEAPPPAKAGKKNKKKAKKKFRRRTGETRKNAAYADVLWALLSTTEFATNH